MDLTSLRDEINGIDNELLELFQRRMEIVQGVARYKIENNLPVFHPKREADILARMQESCTPENKTYVAAFFQSLMDISKQMQQKLIDEHSAKK